MRKNKLLKKIIGLCIIGLFQQSVLYAQCVNDVSTDHNNPTNTKLPIDLINPTGDTRYLNKFDIYPLTPGGSLEDYDLTNMYFAGVQLLEMDNIWSDQVIPYYNYISKQPLPISKNGWELLLLNVGRYPDDTTPNTSNESFQSVPYIVIYNRYSGVMRVFANFGLDQTVGNGPDAVQVILEHSDNKKMSGILRLNEGYDRALDLKSKIVRVTSIAKATNTQRQWFSADFQLAYDPCVCYYPSELQLSFLQIKKEDVNLYGRSISIQDDLINPQLQVNAKDFLTSFDNTTNIPQGGILSYKGMLPLINDYEARLQKYKNDLNAANRHNEIVEHNLGAIKMLKYMLTIIITQGIGGGDIGAFGAVENESWYSTIMERYGSFIKKSNGTFDEKKILNIIKNVIGGETKTYIEQDFEKLPLPKAPNTPQNVTLSEMRFTGSITSTQIKGGPTFYTPGTYGSEGTGSPILSTMYNYPIYNEALGVFAVIETPKVAISDRVYSRETDIQRNPQVLETCGHDYVNVKYQSYTVTTQMQLLNEIKYTLNPALDIKSVNVKAAWNIKAKEKVKHLQGAMWNTYIDPLYTVNLFSKYMDVTKYDSVTLFWNTPYTGNVYEGWCPKLSFPKRPKFDLQTKYYNLNEFHPLKIGAGLKNEFIFDKQWEYQNPFTSGFGIDFDTIELKLMVDVTFNTLNSEGNYNTLTQLLTIPVEIQDRTYIKGEHIDADLHTSWDTGILPDVLTFNNTIFDGSHVKGCYLDNKHYLCVSRENIYIDGVLQTSPGYSVEMLAQDEILVENESELSSEIILTVQKLLHSTTDNYEVSGSYVQRYCKKEFEKGPSYNANLGAKNAFETTDVIENNTEVDNISLRDGSDSKIVIFPNPSKGVFTVESNENIIGIKIVDVQGREISFSKDEVDQNKAIISMQGQGMYIVYITTLSGNDVKQIFVK